PMPPALGWQSKLTSFSMLPSVMIALVSHAPTGGSSSAYRQRPPLTPSFGKGSPSQVGHGRSWLMPVNTNDLVRERTSYEPTLVVPPVNALAKRFTMQTGVPEDDRGSGGPNMQWQRLPPHS